MNDSEAKEIGLEGYESLILNRDDAVTIVERLRETHADTQDKAYVLKIDSLIGRLGTRWETKSALVYEHLKTGFERRFSEPNWCLFITADTWLAIIPTLETQKGALVMAEMWRELAGFFVGDMSDVAVPLYLARALDVDRLGLKAIDLNTYGKSQPMASVGGIPANAGVNRPMIVATTVSSGGRALRVASSVEPLFELKKMLMIGHRLEPMVMGALDNTLWDRKAMLTIDWGLREQVDITNIEQGLKLLKFKEPEQRKMMMVVPAAFSTLASTRARQKITHDVAAAAAEMGLKVLFEVRGLDGVPPHRVLEVVSLIKPFCMTVVGHVSPDRKAISALSRCVLSGVTLEYDGQRREDGPLNEYLAGLSAQAKMTAGACMVQGFDNYRQMAVARLAGVTHASIKAAAMMSPRGASPTQASPAQVPSPVDIQAPMGPTAA
jgi:hypothetical protein